jgi:hypothetical protein
VDRRALYERLKRATDLDALHEIIAARGPSILDRGFPYLLVAARNRARSRHRQETRRSDASPEDSANRSRWDPFEQLSGRETLRRLLDCLAELADEDALILWRHAQGWSDDEILEEWKALGFEPREPSAALLRKRRERARNELARRLGRDRG